MKPEETVVTNVGGGGRTLMGRLKFDTNAPANLEQGQLLIMTPQNYMKKFVELKTKEKQFAYLTSAEARAARDNSRSSGARLNPDGSFSIEGVSPGNYQVRVFFQSDTHSNTIPKAPIFFISKSELTVPPAKTPNDNSIVNCGTIEMFGHTIPMPASTQSTTNQIH